MQEEKNDKLPSVEEAFKDLAKKKEDDLNLAKEVLAKKKAESEALAKAAVDNGLLEKAKSSKATADVNTIAEPKQLNDLKNDYLEYIKKYILKNNLKDFNHDPINNPDGSMTLKFPDAKSAFEFTNHRAKILGVKMLVTDKNGNVLAYSDGSGKGLLKPGGTAATESNLMTNPMERSAWKNTDDGKNWEKGAASSQNNRPSLAAPSNTQSTQAPNKQILQTPGGAGSHPTTELENPKPSTEKDKNNSPKLRSP